MAKEFVLLILFTNLLALNCHEEEILNYVQGQQQQLDTNAKPTYSFSYGVSDADTGDVKAVWETKEGDTVKGHYSVLGPDGTLRSVEYSASPKTGFTAVVNNENKLPETKPTSRSLFDDASMFEEKAMRDYAKYYDYPDEPEEEYYEKRRFKRPYDPFREIPYSHRKRPQFNMDSEPSEYTHSITIKHPRDESSPDGEAHSHVGYSFDPNCKTKTKKESNDNKDNLYANIVDFDLSKAKYPNFPPESFRETFDKYNSEASNFAFEKIKPYGNYKGHKFEEPRPSPSSKYGYPSVPDIPEKYYADDIPPRPKKKNRPHKAPEYPSDDLDDYILVPKKKYKPTRVVEPNDYRHEVDEDYDRPPYPGFGDDEEFRPFRGHAAPKEVIKKIVKKKRPPVINLLDIFDI